MGVLTAIRRGASSAHRNRPFITDIGMDRRTEFTGALFEQWVAKTSNWLESEFGRELQLHMELRAHWLWPVMVAALDELEGTFVPRDRADLVMRIGPEPDCDVPVLAINDHPMALPFTQHLPATHVDFFLEVRAGADVRGWGPAHDLPLIDDGQRLWFADDLGHGLESTSARVAVIVDDRPLRSADDIAMCTVTRWRSTDSLVIARDLNSIAGEQVTHTIDLRG